LDEDTERKQFRSKGLLPWQVDFAICFLKNSDKRYWELVAPAGLGKSRLAASLIAHEFENRSDIRILVLAPTPLLLQHQRELLSFSLPITPLLVDRKTFIELESKAPADKNLWPLPVVILMSTDLAKRADVSAKLSTVNWDLVVIDESHRLIGLRRTLFNKLLESGAIHRALLMSPIENRSLGDLVTKVRVDYKDVLDWSWEPVFSSLNEELIHICYKKTEEERNFLERLQVFVDQLTDKWLPGKFQGDAILQASSSSIFATEAMLLRLKDAWIPLRNKITHQVPWDNEDLLTVQRQLSMDWSDEPDVIDELALIARKKTAMAIKPTEFQILYQQLEMLLDDIEKIGADPKLDALVSKISELFANKDILHVAIVTSFARTAEYINASIQNISIPTYSLLSYMSSDEFSDTLETFRKKGGLLVATDTSLEGIELKFIDVSINYDLPSSPQVLERRLTRFVQFGQEGHLKNVFFIDQSEASLREKELLKKLEDKLSFIFTTLNSKPKNERARAYSHNEQN
jgi:hypothetical protein